MVMINAPSLLPLRPAPPRGLTPAAELFAHELIDTAKVFLGGKDLHVDAPGQIALPTALGGVEGVETVKTMVNQQKATPPPYTLGYIIRYFQYGSILKKGAETLSSTFSLLVTKLRLIK